MRIVITLLLALAAVLAGAPPPRAPPDPRARRPGRGPQALAVAPRRGGGPLCLLPALPREDSQALRFRQGRRQPVAPTSWRPRPQLAFFLARTYFKPGR